MVYYFTITLLFPILIKLAPVEMHAQLSSSSLTINDWSLLPSLIKQKLTYACNAKLSTLDPINLSSLWLVTNDDRDFINATLHKVTINGLASLIVKDIATNDLTHGLSILMKAPGIVVTGYYELSHRSESLKQSFLVDSDSGHFRLKTPAWYTSWFADVASINADNGSVTVRRPWLKSYYDEGSHEFISSQRDQCSFACQHTLNVITKMVLDRVRSEIDDQIHKFIGHIIQEEPIDKANWMNSVRELAEVSTNSLSSSSLSRKKRQVPCKPGKELDEYTDSLFRFATRIVRVMEPFSLPNATVYLPEYNIKVFLYEGGATRAYTLNRKKSAWVHCSNESVSLGLTVGFENLRIRYRYRAIHDWKLLWDGDFEADLADSKLQVQFTQTTPRPEDPDSTVQQRVDRLRIWRLGKTRVIIRGLGNLTQGVGLWISQFLNDPYNQKMLNPSLRRIEVEAVSMINVMLKNFTVPFFTII